MVSHTPSPSTRATASHTPSAVSTSLVATWNHTSTDVDWNASYDAVLAQRLARHTMQGWDNPALPHDVDEIAELLNAPAHITLAYLHKIDRSAQ